MDEAGFLDLISGRKRGLVPGILRGGLKGLSCFYGGVIRLRNCAFDLGIKRVHKASVPVVSVGNLTTGGTGKTPCVAWLARWFREKDIRVSLLSRGYRSLPGEMNDEKLVLDQLCPDVPHVQNPNRVAGASIACREHAAQVLILDDGFQHRRLGRDLDLVLIDTLNPWGYGSLLPRGLLREPVASLQRADLVVLTRADQCTAKEKEEILKRIQHVRGERACVEVGYPPECLMNSEGEQTELSSLAGKQVFAFCGIGNPEAFHQSLSGLGYEVGSFQAFPDHHHFSDRELDEIGEQARQSGVSAILVTQKDLVKINKTELGGVPLWAVRIGARILSGGDLLEARLQGLMDLMS